MNPNILGVIGPGFLNQVPTLDPEPFPDKKHAQAVGAWRGTALILLGV